MKMKTLLFWFSMLFLQPAFGQSTIGTEFWLGYMENLNLLFNDPPVFTLYVDAAQTTNVTVEVPQTGLVLDFVAAAGDVTSYTLPAAIWYTEESEVVDNKGIKVTTDEPVQLYAFHYRAYFSESTQVLPITELDTDYWVNAFYDDFQSVSPSSFVIVSTADDNEIEITPSSFTLGLHPANVPFTITLDEGQNYPVQAVGDLTGSRVRSLSEQPIAVFAGAQEANVELCGANSHLYDQSIPNSLWGTEYYFVPLSGQGGDVVKILAAEDNTEVFLNCESETTLNAGEVYRIKLLAPTVINASSPITVAQFNSSQECNASQIGDPNMLNLFPTDHQGFEARFESPNATSGIGFSYFSKHFVNIVTAGSDVNVIQLNGNNIASSFSTFPGNTSLAYAQIELSAGTQILESSAPFYAYSYGFGDYDAYTYNLGYSTIEPVPLVCLEVFSDGLFCVDSLITFSVLSNQDIQSYSWDLGNAQTSTLASPGTSYATPGFYTVTIEVILADGSTLSESISLQIFDCPTNPCIDPVSVEIIADGDPCEGPVQFSYVSDSTFNTLVWDLGNGLLYSEQSPDFEYPDEGTYTVTLMAYDIYNCLYTASFELEVPDCNGPCSNAGEVNILVDGTFCVDSLLTFSVDVDFDQIGIVLVDWIFSNGQTFFTDEVTLTFTEPGDYVVEFFGEELFYGCEYFGALEFTIDDNCIVDPCENLPGLSLGIQGEFCTDSLLIFNYSTTANLVAYEWVFNNGVVINDPIAAISFAPEGVYGYTFTAFDADGCEFNETFLFDIEDCEFIDPCLDLDAMTIVTDGVLCLGETLSFQAQVNANLTDYEWDFGIGIPFIDPNPTYVFPAVGTYEVFLTAFDNNGCEYFAEIMFDILDCDDPCTNLPPLNITGETTYCSTETVELGYTTDAGLVEVEWSAGLIAGTGDNFSFIPPEGVSAEMVTLEATDINGCDYFETVTIEIEDCTPEEECEIYFPNIFSPNGDGTNDSFRALYQCPPTSYYLAIYSRWGGLIFETTNPELAWDGTFEGEEMPTEVYALFIRYQLPGGEEKQEYGDLTLVR